MKFVKYFVFFLCASLLLNSCSRVSNNDESEQNIKFLSADGPKGSFPNTVEIRTWGIQSPDAVLPEGQTWDDNIWTRGIKESLNIDVKFDWWAPAPEYNQKLNTSLAGGDLPDLISSLPYEVYVRLAKANKLVPLDEALDTYGSNDLKELMNAYGGLHREKLTINGKLYGIAPPENNNPVMVAYIRPDWLTNLGLEKPKTMDDFFSIVEAFVNSDPDKNGKKDTSAIALSGDIFGAGFNLMPLFAMYKAYPTTWVEKDGKLVFGSTTIEAKQALEKIASLYKLGAFPKEFFTINPWDIGEALIQSKIGIVLGYYWFPQWAYETTKRVADVEWEPFVLPNIEDKPAITSMTLTPGLVMAMKADTKFPEAAVKIYNYSLEHYYNDENFALIKDKDGNLREPLFLGWGNAYAFSHIIEMKQIVDLLPKALRNKDPSNLAVKYQKEYEKVLEFQETKNVDLIGNYGFEGPDGSFKYNSEMYRSKDLPINAYLGPTTDNFLKLKPQLLSKSVELFTKIIVGDESIEAFDKEWLVYWKNNGGKTLEDEANEWFKNK